MLVVVPDCCDRSSADIRLTYKIGSFHYYVDLSSWFDFFYPSHRGQSKITFKAGCLFVYYWQLCERIDKLTAILLLQFSLTKTGFSINNTICWYFKRTLKLMELTSRWYLKFFAWLTTDKSEMAKTETKNWKGWIFSSLIEWKWIFTILLPWAKNWTSKTTRKSTYNSLNQGCHSDVIRYSALFWS